MTTPDDLAPLRPSPAPSKTSAERPAADTLTDSDHIVVRGLTKTYPGATVPVLHDIDLVVPRGTFISLIGPSGCGKSTLLRTFAGIDEYDSGNLTLFGATPEQACAQKTIGLVPQTPALLPWLTVRKNVALPAKINKSAGRLRARRGGVDGASAPNSGPPLTADPDQLLELVGLTDAAGKYPGELSGGMQQRVAIARAFGLRPDLLLMDEPFSALDEFTREAMRLHLLDLWQRMRTTVVFVTHSVAEAVTLSDTIVVMSARPGRIHQIIDVGLPRPRTAELLAGPATHALEDRVRTSLHDAWLASTPPTDLVPS
ncbi:ABC transporter ATP-binding protein [Streptomyces sp. NL15-2K]|uniref:ABC transporter ATP-binding protein n=1 Tax=Streptomyces sp. NL15-2K TaxID=376149 RepID=UPI000F55A472|nr:MULTISPECIES: ABC transporter ATP-binding protein [Actinomycetes]WKX15176.1 ABC transporter ATP-binding protein [Kutzneria buriramensis]GCB52268.1 pyrimidine ABC transporter [Streptomyces sp. NL15-2K]